MIIQYTPASFKRIYTDLLLCLFCIVFYDSWFFRFGDDCELFYEVDSLGGFVQSSVELAVYFVEDASADPKAPVA